MKKKNFLFYFAVLYLIFTIAQAAYFMARLNELGSERDMTAQVSGEIRFCMNHPPILDYACPGSVYQEENYTCQINASDEDNQTLDFQLSFISSPQIFTLPGSGLINFSPNNSDVGNHTFMITVMDSLGCENSADSDIFSIEVININDPPELISNIPNQTWEQDTTYSPFDLDLYFYDPDSDILTYTYTLLDNIDVSIDSDNKVTFNPIDGWYGTENIIFFAWDPFYANASSNNITLTVTQIPEDEETPPSGGSSGGGGGGGSSPLCLPKWYCRPWGPCEPDSLRRRECYDLNNCTTEIGKPNITEPCEFLSTCYDGFKGPQEEGIDCGGPCPACGNCYDNLCNNGEDCVFGLTKTADCGGPCKQCAAEPKESCYDSICNNGEDCVFGLTRIPDCGGSCTACPETETPGKAKGFNFALLFFALFSLLLISYILKKAYPYLILLYKKRKKKYYESMLMLEAKVSESIYESLLNLEKLLYKEDIQKLILIFAGIVRKYFKSLLTLKYEFTYEELISEIESKNISPTFKTVLRKFFERSTEVEFSGKAVSVEELKAMISEFKHILAMTSNSEFRENLGEEKIDKAPAGKTENVFSKISNAEDFLLRDKINEAYDLYVSILSDYKSLNPKDKQKLQGFLSRLYEEIKLSREKYDYEHSNL